MIPVQNKRMEKKHPCNGLEYTIEYEYWHNPKNGSYYTSVKDIDN